MEFYPNGFIVYSSDERDYVNGNYGGICAYKRITPEKGYFITDINELKKYPSFRILYIESDYDKECCSFVPSFAEKTFLGYETFVLPFTAYPVSELYTREYFKCYRDRLNGYGLLDEEWHAFRYFKDYRSFLSLNLLGDGWTDVFFAKVYSVKL